MAVLPIHTPDGTPLIPSQMLPNYQHQSRMAEFVSFFSSGQPICFLTAETGVWARMRTQNRQAAIVKEAGNFTRQGG